MQMKSNFLSKYAFFLHISKKSCTFAADFGIPLGER